MALSAGCAAKGKTPAEAFPPFPEPGVEFTQQGDMVCLDQENASRLFLWILALERYEAAIRGGR